MRHARRGGVAQDYIRHRHTAATLGTTCRLTRLVPSASATHSTINAPLTPTPNTARPANTAQRDQSKRALAWMGNCHVACAPLPGKARRGGWWLTTKPGCPRGPLAAPLQRTPNPVQCKSGGAMVASCKTRAGVGGAGQCPNKEQGNVGLDFTRAIGSPTTARWPITDRAAARCQGAAVAVMPQCQCRAAWPIATWSCLPESVARAIGDRGLRSSGQIRSWLFYDHQRRRMPAGPNPGQGLAESRQHNCNTPNLDHPKRKTRAGPTTGVWVKRPEHGDAIWAHPEHGLG